MKLFNYVRATSPEQAVTLIHGSEDANKHNGAFIAGGTNLLDLMKFHIETPEQLVDISRLELGNVEKTEDGGLRIGAMVSNSDLASHKDVINGYPVLSRAILAGATGQLRNKASTGGNFLQRTRCYYFYQPDSPCNKREPGSGCPAINGENRKLAILGISEHCIAQHPSDMAVAMRVLDAKIETLTTDGKTRQIDIADFYSLPKDTPNIETVLEPSELITHVILPAPVKGAHTYDKVRDRASYAFAVVSCAAIIDRAEDGTLNNVQIAFGGIASQPWRNKEMEDSLKGSKGTDADITVAADILLKETKGHGQNDFKIPLTRRLLTQVIKRASHTNTISTHSKEQSNQAGA